MHNSGCKMLRAWIYTQTTFPGDKDLQVRTLRSAVTVPPIRVELDPPDPVSVRISRVPRATTRTLAIGAVPTVATCPFDEPIVVTPPAVDLFRRAPFRFVRVDPF
uniref:Uncharacterized protein n=1 Tax=Globodera pallida TaxID=36090 RepID=A0A183BN75_GLOPA